MKKFMIAIILITAGMTSPAVVENSQAQTHVERKVVYTKKRKTRRRTRRRVRRRVTRRAHYAYRHLPRYRATVRVVPKGAVVVRRGNVTYHYHNGIFYRPRASAFVVARPAVGVKVRVLPPARTRIVVAKRTYFYYYGTFYQEKDGEYEVTGAPEGALVAALPEGYDVEEIDGTEYYVLDGVHYQEVETDELEDGVGYEVVNV